MPDRELIRLVVFGDSICFGQYVSQNLCWVTKVGQRLDDLRRQDPSFPRVRLQNPSVNGSTTRGALERMPFDVQAHGVDAMYVQFGLNDCNHWQTDNGLPRVSPAAFRANLEEIIERARKAGARCVVVGTNHPSGRDKVDLMQTGSTFEAWNCRYNELIRQVVAGYRDDVVLHDVHALWSSRGVGRGEARDALLLDDGIHLSERGHELYYSTAVDLLVEAVRQAAGK